MNIDKLFKVPALPSSSNKRKFGDLPSAEELKRFKPAEEEPTASNLAKGKQRATVEDYDEDEENQDPYGTGLIEDFGDEDDEGRMFGGGLNEDQRTILDMFDRAGDDEDDEPTVVTLPTLRKQLVQFERTVKKNQEMRVKFPDEPEKFIDSESNLDTALHALTATLPQNPKLFYPELVKQGTVKVLSELLSHENADIALDVVQVLQELTEEDVEAPDDDGDDDDGEEDDAQVTSGMRVLIDALLEVDIFQLLIENLGRLNEKEDTDRQGVFQTLGIFENLLSFNPTLAETLVNSTTALKWLLSRITVEEYDSNKQYASEVLAILLQQSRSNRLKLGELEGIDALLRVLARYRKSDPSDPEEEEFMENSFDALCSALAEPELKQLFLEAEGVELMVICMKEKKLARARSIKVLDHALSGSEGSDNCERFVENLGLKTLFAAFMGKGSKKSHVSAEDNEHILGILVSLFTNLASESQSRMRLLAKFIEGDYEKVDRLLELREEAEGRLTVVEREIEKEKQSTYNAGQEVDVEDEVMFYLRRLEGGLFTLQNIDYILAWLIMEDDGAKDQAKLLLSRKDQTFQEIVDVLQEQSDNVGDLTPDGKLDPKAESQKIILDALMNYLKGSM
ncbi:Uncharacterized conserved protein [Phaffia rhodozyma]|uniref:Uncharacterized conserved protein n=1 Tax=Phaffia rhodozyma TaxID=264483 RepID=A0A0F7SMS9_PHARH|nr:Uncharacterized conserved protein [Phaffia rhodozyma]